MAAQAQSQTLRLRCDETSRGAVLDAYTNSTPQAWARAATQFQTGLASGGVLVDVGNLASVTLEASPYNTRTAARVLSKTVQGNALNNALTEATWVSGAQQHAVFAFSSAEMNVLTGGSLTVDLWIVVSAITTAGDPIIFATGRLTVNDPGTLSSALAPPANPGAYATLDQATAVVATAIANLTTQTMPQLPLVAGLTGGGDTHLDGLPTVALLPGTMVDIFLPGAGRVTYRRFRDGDATIPAGATPVRPLDYDAASNPHQWDQVA